MSYVYVASPYTHDDPAVRAERYRQAARYTAHLVAKRIPAYSPIVHGHTMAEFGVTTIDHEFWMAQCLPMLFHAHRLYVLQIEGWEASRGVAVEIEHAHQWRMPILLVDAETMKMTRFHKPAA